MENEWISKTWRTGIRTKVVNSQFPNSKLSCQLSMEEEHFRLPHKQTSILFCTIWRGRTCDMVYGYPKRMPIIERQINHSHEWSSWLLQSILIYSVEPASRFVLSANIFPEIDWQLEGQTATSYRIFCPRGGWMQPHLDCDRCRCDADNHEGCVNFTY